jgi:hypothetical protein
MGFPSKLIRIIQQLYKNLECLFVHGGRLTSPFTVNIGEKQGCMLALIIFLMVIYWIMRHTTVDNNMGIRGTFTKQTGDLNIADDVDILISKQQHTNMKLSTLDEESKYTGLKISKKTKVLRINEQQDPLQLHGENIKEIDRFTYLRRVFSKDT